MNKCGRGHRGGSVVQVIALLFVLKYEYDRKRLRVGSSTYLRNIFYKNIDLFYRF